MRHLRAEGHRARVLTTGYRRPGVDPGREAEPEVYRELEWYWEDHEWRALGFRQRLALERHNADVFDRHLDEFRPSVVTWWPVGGMSLGLIERARRAGIPAVFFMHDNWLSYGPEHDLWIRTWSRLGPLASLADRITGLPTRVRYAAAGRWTFNSTTVRDAVAHTLDDGTVISPGVERALLREPREPELPPWQWRLLYVGRVVEQKGVETAIEALGHLPAAASLRIVGDGDRRYRRHLEALGEQLGLGARVAFEGAQPRERIPSIYRAADAVVFPVRWAEPWGLVPLEAMALGRPVLATGRGGSADYLRDGENSLLFEAGDPVTLASAVRRLAEDPALRRRLREAGYETAARHSEDEFNERACREILSACE